MGIRGGVVHPSTSGSSTGTTDPLPAPVGKVHRLGVGLVMRGGGSRLGHGDRGLLRRLGSPAEGGRRREGGIRRRRGGRRGDVVWAGHRQTASKLHGRRMQELLLLLRYPWSTTSTNHKNTKERCFTGVTRRFYWQGRTETRQIKETVRYRKPSWESVCLNLPAIHPPKGLSSIPRHLKVPVVLLPQTNSTSLALVLLVIGEHVKNSIGNSGSYRYKQSSFRLPGVTNTCENTY